MHRTPLVLASLLMTQIVACGGDDGSQIDTEAETGSGAETESSDAGSGTGGVDTTDGSSADDSTGEPDPTGDTDDTGDEPACEAVRFGAASTWTLPDLSALPLTVTDMVAAAADNWGCENDQSFRYTTMDLTGDGQLDFVITDGCDAGGVGAQRWIVHPGGDGGFGAATTWMLPDLSALPLSVTEPVAAVADNWGCENDQSFRYTTMDLTGDGQVDFVITDGCDAGGVGEQRWIVHPGEDGGFGAATTWTLPDLSALPLSVTDPVAAVADNWGCENDQSFRYTMMDVTGDGRPDFVITDGCDAGGVGQQRWIVHPGQDGGFGAATTWALPDLSALPLSVTDPVAAVADNWGCENDQSFRYTTMDLTGDHLPDFVITDGCDAGGVGQQRWIVHPGEDGGFGAATTWTLPDLSALPLSVADPVAAVADNWGCENDRSFRYTMMDLTGDGLADFVITDGCDAGGVGEERWIVHPGGDGGFGAASTWPLPDLSALPIAVPDPVAAVADNWGCDNDRSFRYTSMDLTGDRLLDFVITDGCDEGGVGAQRWIVHAGECE